MTWVGGRTQKSIVETRRGRWGRDGDVLFSFDFCFVIWTLCYKLSLL